MTEHEACPFCGGSAAIDARLIGPWTTGAYTIYFVACFECGAPSVARAGRTSTLAIARKRARKRTSQNARRYGAPG